jgi:hypothetical protein
MPSMNVYQFQTRGLKCVYVHSYMHVCMYALCTGSKLGHVCAKTHICVLIFSYVHRYVSLRSNQSLDGDWCHVNVLCYLYANIGGNNHVPLFWYVVCSPNITLSLYTNFGTNKWGSILSNLYDSLCVCMGGGATNRCVVWDTLCKTIVGFKTFAVRYVIWK